MIIENLAEFASKKFGQNFLKNDVYLHKIIQAMPNDDLRVSEIGPGLGDLTKELVKVRNVTAFEVDKRLCEHLKTEFEVPMQNGRFELRCGDVLERWVSGSLLDEPYHLVANLPYYIATTIILKAFKDEQCQSILVMVQKEVAVKFAARVKQKEFSSLSVLAASIGKATLCFEVEPEAFVPAPNVTSAVLLIEKNRSQDDEKFEAFLKIAFAQPRKKLIKNLTAVFPKDSVDSIFAKLELDSNLRPHEAETSIYHHIYNELKDNLDGKQQSAQRKQSKSRAKNTQNGQS
ncbi:MAG TPA: 16S rRNA (adenine(1518)-N(6)/adenine(1519)-N(6))-dimethyltransferase RsmA [Sulfurovum sp.]|nr:MAG: 16S rRNA (adenine(1518)-N(6)/adenine(1519)-N(6))-dimethyltransferase [Sulfurovum sp. 35-42-20]OYZ25002.1 MAG: 16S rRNA (adenine(1518)-N(6)/adenine(1519)-N(6))-dimethyltransferase [Sulfurovum sp. 16-42-52]OZA44914.1 MAG: 16S rRNA (adenine(1518)-N(6)/adenine(1519)-N(6))-dimethyltransferase [Sulfurovum sp. 17-42-90]OZA59793.1 MAG: 16S rRNA (adenine(1518)-N(6)/adenine(1519)-N(6))-dimethyltransferase [Sulfurovum sp. 39-42-12]HQR73720.1 16S rRNA (adenine(1518)-N(6)/adenine(1519)-N(6))-dimethy